MIVGLSIVALVFLGISFIITHGNAAQLLSGYNTMSEQERENVDIIGYVTFFRKFYRVFSVVYFFGGAILFYFVNTDVAGVFMVIAPLVAVLIQSLKSATYTIENNNKSAKVVGSLLVGIILLVIGLLWLGYKENELVLENNDLKITGIYGETIPLNAIDSIALVNELPEISVKSNGFALGTASKGHFKTKDGEPVKLLINQKSGPYILIQKADNSKLYYSSKKLSTIRLYQQLLQKLN
jgi:hypothetical protein